MLSLDVRWNRTNKTSARLDQLRAHQATQRAVMHLHIIEVEVDVETQSRSGEASVFCSGRT